jgi:hypothetical protein
LAEQQPQFQWRKNFENLPPCTEQYLGLSHVWEVTGKVYCMSFEATSSQVQQHLRRFRTWEATNVAAELA